MVDIERLIADIHQLSNQQKTQLQQELILIMAGIDATEAQSLRDIVPIDVPIESIKNKDTGVLRIRFPYEIGLRNNLGWREMEVTQAAQLNLLRIFSESLEDDAKSGRIQTKSTLIQ